MVVQTKNKDDFQDSLLDVLERINEEGEFFTSVIMDAEGLSLAEVSSHYDINAIAVIPTMLQLVIQRAESQRTFSKVDEVSFLDNDEKIKLVARYFYVIGQLFVLVLLFPKGKAYRKLANKATKEIKLILSQVIQG